MSTAVETTTVDQVSDTVDLGVVSPGSRAVATMPSVPDVPKALTESKSPFARAMVGTFSAMVGMARDAQAVIQRFAEGNAELDKNLTVNETDNAVVLAYRQALVQAEQERKESEAQFEREIAQFKADHEARLAAIDQHVTDFKTPAVKELGGQVGVTLEESLEARQTYKAAADSIKTNVANLKKQGIDLGSYAFPALKTGAKGSNGGTTEFRPRFQTATLNGSPVQPDAKGRVTPVQVAAALGITRDQLVKLLTIQALDGDRDVFDSAAPHTPFAFNVTNNGVESHVIVTKGERKSPVAKSTDSQTDSVETEEDDDEE